MSESTVAVRPTPVRVEIRESVVTVVHATAGPQGIQGVPGQDAQLPDEWASPPDLTLLFENALL